METYRKTDRPALRNRVDGCSRGGRGNACCYGPMWLRVRNDSRRPHLCMGTHGGWRLARTDDRAGRLRSPRWKGQRRILNGRGDPNPGLPARLVGSMGSTFAHAHHPDRVSLLPSGQYVYVVNEADAPRGPKIH